MMSTEKQGSKKAFRILLILVGLLYVGVIIRFVLFKDGFRADNREIILKPFNMLRKYQAGQKSLSLLAINYLGNIGMFVPFGILLPAIFQKLNYVWVVIIGCLSAIGIEIVQYLTASGYTDIDDVILNTLGVAIGAFLFFVVLRGKKRSLVSQILALLLVLLIGAASAVGIWRYRPNLLPQGTVVYGNQIAGESIDGYDMRVFCYKMSHGEVFLNSRTAEDKDGNKVEGAVGAYKFTDTAIFVISEAGDAYKVAGIEDMIATISEREGATVRLWMNENGECRMVLIETEDDEI